MKTKLIITSLAVCIGFFSSCQKEEDTLPFLTNIDTPSTYTFVDVNGKSTVATGGMFVRIQLIKELVAEIAKAETETVSEQTLLDLFEKNNDELDFYTDVDIKKSLEAKTLNSDDIDETFQQAGKDTLRRWLAQVADLSGASGTYIRADGVDLKQAVEKFLMGAVLYDQAVNHYLDISPNASNDNFTEGLGTSMQHTFDEAFGYFGASRYFNDLTNTEIINGGADVDGVSGLNLVKEGCYYFATTAAKRENAGVSTTLYTNVIFDNFLSGRTATVNSSISTLNASIANIEKYWEEIIAATAVHYINETLNDMGTDETVVLPNTELSKHWTEMYYYFYMLTIDGETLLSDTEKTNIAVLMGNDGGYASPVGVTQTDLKAARDYFDVYFSSSQLEQW